MQENEASKKDESELAANEVATQSDAALTVGSGGEITRQTNLASRFAVPFVLLALALLVWGLSLASPLLLDEQFLLQWLKDCRSLTGSSGIQGFMSWHGFAKPDAFGFVSHGFMLTLSFLFGSSAFFFRFVGLLLHVGNSILLFLCCRKIAGKDWFFPIFVSALFAVYPLHFESVVWVPGIPTALASLAFLGAFLTYLTAREKGFNWLYAAVISLLALLSIASTRSMWPAFFAFGLFELFNWMLPPVRGEKQSGDPTLKVISCLLPLVIVGAYCAATGSLMTAFVPDFKLPNLRQEYLSLFFPVNQMNWQKYSAEYRFFYITYGLLSIPAFMGLSLNRQARRVCLLCISFFLLFSLPFVGVGIADSTLYGERFLYLASIGFCMLLGSLLAAPALLQGRWKLAGALAGSAVAIMLLITFGRHCWNEAASNRNSARILKSMQKSLKILAEKNAISLLLVRDLPNKLSRAPELSVRGPVAFDPATGLLRSNPVPDGRLKDLLRKNRMRDAALRWESNLQSFLPLLLPSQKLLWTELDAQKITDRMEPALPFYKNVHLSEDKKELILESNSENGPMLTLYSADLDPLEQDYLYVDAKIDAPTSFAAPRIELHWQTNVHEEFERAERFTYVDAIINDGKVHRYKLSLRSNGWTTGGVPKDIAIGFPAGARVHLQRIGVINAADDIAILNDAQSTQVVDLSRKRFTPPYFNYPYSHELGLIPLSDDADSIKANYSVDHIEGSAGILAELSWPNKSFDDANSNHGSGVCYKTVRQSGNKGELVIPVKGLPGPGVYSLRVIASAANGTYLGQFSDPICFQVPRIPEEN